MHCMQTHGGAVLQTACLVALGEGHVMLHLTDLEVKFLYIFPEFPHKTAERKGFCHRETLSDATVNISGSNLTYKFM